MLQVHDSAARWRSFLQETHANEVSNLAAQWPEKLALEVGFDTLQAWDPNFASLMLEQPRSVLNQGHSTLKALCTEAGYETTPKIRVIHLPPDAVYDLRSVGSDVVEKLVAVEVIVTKVSELKPRVYSATFACGGCTGTIELTQMNELELVEPSTCDTCGAKKPQVRFELVTNDSTLIDNQWIEIQELPENVKSGAQPTRMRVLAEADLAGVHHPGARITANVIPFIRSQKKGGQKTPMFDVHLSLISSEHQNTPLEEIDISDEDRDEILELSSREDLFELMTRSIAPNIYATGKIPFVKRSLALQLFGGVPRRYSDGTRTRGDIHILMMGDPGVAKSQLLSFMGRISPRGRFTTGGGTTAAGLTAAAVRDAFNDGRFSLEAGALVLADMGLCAVDEFDKMSDADRGAMHEAMEQQVINISKAGISASMRTRCAVLAAANPRRGRFDNEGANFEQIDLPPPLISRFDIIWLIRDEVRMEQDRNIAQYILQSRRKGVAEQKIEFGQEVDPRSLASDKVRDVDTNGNEVIPVPLYQKYVAYAKRNIFPELTDEAMEEIVNYYTETRSKYSQEDGSVPVTARALEALIRLAEAHARMELRNEATVDDAKLAISLYKHWRYELMGDDFDELTIRTGTSTQRRSAERVLMSVVRNLCRELGGECETIQIYNVAGEQGIDEDTVDRVLQNLNARGSIFCPRIGIWRIA